MKAGTSAERASARAARLTSSNRIPFWLARWSGSQGRNGGPEPPGTRAASGLAAAARRARSAGNRLGGVLAGDDAGQHFVDLLRLLEHLRVVLPEIVASPFI